MSDGESSSDSDDTLSIPPRPPRLETHFLAPGNYLILQGIDGRFSFTTIQRITPPEPEWVDPNSARIECSAHDIGIFDLTDRIVCPFRHNENSQQYKYPMDLFCPIECLMLVPGHADPNLHPDDYELAQWESEYSADNRIREEAVMRDIEARLFVEKLVQRIQKLMRRSMIFRMKGLEEMVNIKTLRDSINWDNINTTDQLFHKLIPDILSKVGEEKDRQGVNAANQIIMALVGDTGGVGRETLRGLTLPDQSSSSSSDSDNSYSFLGDGLNEGGDGDVLNGLSNLVQQSAPTHISNLPSVAIETSSSSNEGGFNNEVYPISPATPNNFYCLVV